MWDNNWNIAQRMCHSLFHNGLRLLGNRTNLGPGNRCFRLLWAAWQTLQQLFVFSRRTAQRKATKEEQNKIASLQMRKWRGKREKWFSSIAEQMRKTEFQIISNRNEKMKKMKKKFDCALFTINFARYVFDIIFIASKAVSMSILEGKMVRCHFERSLLKLPSN